MADEIEEMVSDFLRRMEINMQIQRVEKKLRSKKRKEKVFTFRVTEKLKQKINEAAEKEGRSASQQVIFLICKGLGIEIKDIY